MRVSKARSLRSYAALFEIRSRGGIAKRILEVHHYPKECSIPPLLFFRSRFVLSTLAGLFLRFAPFGGN